MAIYNVKDTEMVSFSTNYNPTTSSLLDQLFPNKKVEDIKIAYMNMPKKATTQMAEVHTYNSESKIAKRAPFSAEKVNTFLIKEKIPLDEEAAILYDTLKDNTVVKNFIFNDAAKMADRVRMRTLVMKGEVLSSGKFTIKEQNQDITVDFKVPSGNKFTYTWSTGTPDILANIQTMVDTARAKGYVVTRAVTSSKNIGIMRKDASIRKAILGVNSDKLLTQRELNEFLKENYGFVVVAFDDTYTYEKANGTTESKRLFPENTFVLFGGDITDTLGNGFYTVTPTERSARRTGLVTTAQSNQMYIYCNIWHDEDPNIDWTKAEGVFAPILADPDNLYIATIS